MKRSRKRSWLSGLPLAAVLFRALIPVGFMPAVAADGSLGMIFCPIAVSTGPGAAHEHHPGHDGGSAGSAGTGHQQLACPFAASVGLAPLPDLVEPAAGPAEFLALTHGVSERQFVPTILRAQSPRAPPGVA